MSTFPKALLTAKLPPKSLLSMKSGGRNPRRDMRSRADYSPVKWSHYFNTKQDVIVDGNSFRVYTKGEEGPVLVLLHGGGFSALSWSILSSMLVEIVECRILAIDLRGHGDTITTDDNNLSIDTLANDVVSVINIVLQPGTPVILVGHSLGGSIAVHAGHHPNMDSLVGLVVIDVVEGTALGALSSMQSILRGRPQSFKTIDDAIRWSVQSGQLKNLESAKVSMPGQIKNAETNYTATYELETMDHPEVETTEHFKKLSTVESISEDEEACFKQPSISREKYTWRIDLRNTEGHWPGWFQGLSKLFLSCHAQKLLLLASLDRLDTDLTVAQMQGKFEIHAFEQSRGRCGHIVHEDIPDAVADVLATYLVRNRFAAKKADFESVMPCC